MKAKKAQRAEELPEALKDWLQKQRPIPDGVAECKTFYEAAKKVEEMKWRREVDRFAALHTWATARLIGNQKTRKYMADLIRDEGGGMRWTIDTGSATRAAMTEIFRDHSKDRKRTFTQHRNAAAKSLRDACSHIGQIEEDVKLRVLLESMGMEDLLRAINQVQQRDFVRMRKEIDRARTRASEAGSSEASAAILALGWSAMTRRPTIPSFPELLEAAATHIAEMTPPKFGRHTARSIYLRALFTGLRDSSIHRSRKAFLLHACAAVFGEVMEKRDVGRLVDDLAKGEKAEAEAWAVGEGQFLAEPAPPAPKLRSKKGGHLAA